jgi:N-acetylmuramoyl-L-alanine amidase
MARYTVKQGDTMLSIAAAHDFTSWEMIWMDPANEPLRGLRPDPQVLAEGDAVEIPEKKMRVITLETDKKHTVTVKSIRAWFRVTLRGNDGELLANRRFQLEVAGKLKTGTTGPSGEVELEVDPKPSVGTLKAFFDDADPGKALTWTVKLGHLDPIEKLSGVKARLANLGFACGKIDEELSDEAKNALRNFQIVHRLPVTGQADEATKDLLLAVHDNR